MGLAGGIPFVGFLYNQDMPQPVDFFNASRFSFPGIYYFHSAIDSDKYSVFQGSNKNVCKSH